jgi:glycosyltransferase involved in cell wall biosynthesis
VSKHGSGPEIIDLKVLLTHNKYRQPGGEDEVFRTEAEFLEERGHKVLRYSVHNERVADMNPVVLAGSTVWNRSSYRELRSLIHRERPQVAHFHNTLPLISPSGYYAAKAEGVPVVQTLHNYRLLCPNALFFRDGHVCEDCQGKFTPWPGILHACYRGSRPASAAVAAMLSTHRGLRTWTEQVDMYIVTTEFAREKFIQGGFRAEKLVVKPHFLHPAPSPDKLPGDYALLVGRLSPEKGMRTLLAAWKRLRDRIPLKIVGDGPLAEEVADATAGLERAEWLGRQPRERVLALMKGASVLVFPSTCYENFPMTILEAYAVGLPVIASNLGGMSSLIDHGRTGLHFRPGDPKDLAAKVEWASAHPAELAGMRREARGEFEAKYTAERNYKMLMEIYETVVP